MEKQVYSDTVRAILDATQRRDGRHKRCLTSHDKQSLKKAETEFREMLNSSLHL